MHVKTQLTYLGLKKLESSWEAVLEGAQKQKPSYHRFLCDIVKAEYLHLIM